MSSLLVVVDDKAEGLPGCYDASLGFHGDLLRVVEGADLVSVFLPGDVVVAWPRRGHDFHGLGGASGQFFGREDGYVDDYAVEWHDVGVSEQLFELGEGDLHSRCTSSSRLTPRPVPPVEEACAGGGMGVAPGAGMVCVLMICFICVWSLFLGVRFCFVLENLLE